MAFDYGLLNRDKQERCFRELQKSITDWSDAVLPASTPASVACKFQEEHDEFMDGQAPDEAADCVILLMIHAHLAGYDLQGEIEKKMVKNRSRRQQLMPDGTYHHIKEGV